MQKAEQMREQLRLLALQQKQIEQVLRNGAGPPLAPKDDGEEVTTTSYKEFVERQRAKGNPMVPQGQPIFGGGYNEETLTEDGDDEPPVGGGPQWF